MGDQLPEAAVEAGKTKLYSLNACPQIPDEARERVLDAYTRAVLSAASERVDCPMAHWGDGSDDCRICHNTGSLFVLKRETNALPEQADMSKGATQ